MSSFIHKKRMLSIVSESISPCGDVVENLLKCFASLKKKKLEAISGTYQRTNEWVGRVHLYACVFKAICYF